MRWHRQVAHVLAKDLREQSRLAIVHLALLGASTTAVVREAIFAPDLPVGLPTLLFLALQACGPLVIAAAVLGDRPADPTAFWTSRPFYPSAVATSKLAFAAIVIALPVLLAQWVVLAVYHIDQPMAARLIAVSIGWIGAVIVLGAVAASQTRTLRTVALLGFVAATVLLVGTFGQAFWGHALGSWARPLRWASMGALLTILFAAYARRETSWVSRLVAGPFALLAIASVWSGPAPTTSRAAPRDLMTVVPMLQSTTGAVHGPSIPDLSLTLAVPSIPSAYARRLKSARAIIWLRDGSEFEVPARPFGQAELGHPVVPADLQARWLTPAESIEPGRTAVIADVDSTDWRRMAGGVDSITVLGSIAVDSAYIAARLPFTSGASMSLPGFRGQIQMATHTDTMAAATIRARSFSGGTNPDLRFIIGGSRMNLALVNRTRGEAAALSFSGWSGGVSFAGTPPLNVTTGTLQVQCCNHLRSDARPDDAWLSHAELIVYGQRFVGSYPFRSSASFGGRPILPD